MMTSSMQTDDLPQQIHIHNSWEQVVWLCLLLLLHFPAAGDSQRAIRNAASQFARQEQEREQLMATGGGDID